jgi:hypothetical protein
MNDISDAKPLDNNIENESKEAILSHFRRNFNILQENDIPKKKTSYKSN